MYIIDFDIFFIVVIEMMVFVDLVELGGNYLVYLFKYVVFDDLLLDVDDVMVCEMFLLYLYCMYFDLVDVDVLVFRVSRVCRVFAVLILRFSDVMFVQRILIFGFELVGSAQFFFVILNVNDTFFLLEG